jgi:hypothetical protein
MGLSAVVSNPDPDIYLLHPDKFPDSSWFLVFLTAVFDADNARCNLKISINYHTEARFQIDWPPFAQVIDANFGDASVLPFSNDAKSALISDFRFFRRIVEFDEETERDILVDAPNRIPGSADLIFVSDDMAVRPVLFFTSEDDLMT